MKQKLGRQGEDIAVYYLQREGYKILDRNFRNRYGELDIICRKNGVIVFVEVKTRRSETFGSAEEAITAKKIEHIRKVALHYLSQAIKYNEIRFDVITVTLDGEKPRLNHIQAAF